jgi:hypothetical protein
MLIPSQFISMNIISLKLTWKWGGAKKITCSDTMTLEEVARDHGFADVSETTPLYISRGEILDPIFTLRALEIADGQNIIVYLPTSARSRRPQRSARDLWLPARRYRTLRDIEEEEEARLADQDFANWESARAFPLVMKQLLTMIEDEEAEQTIETPPMPTILMPSTQISEDPLPRLPDLRPSWMAASGLTFTDLP